MFSFGQWKQNEREHSARCTAPCLISNLLSQEIITHSHYSCVLKSAYNIKQNHPWKRQVNNLTVIVKDPGNAYGEYIIYLYFQITALYLGLWSFFANKLTSGLNFYRQYKSGRYRWTSVSAIVVQWETSCKIKIRRGKKLALRKITGAIQDRSFEQMHILSLGPFSENIPGKAETLIPPVSTRGKMW